MVGENLNLSKWYWRTYSFLCRFTNPPIHITDNYAIAELREATLDMFIEVNRALIKYGMILTVMNGNIYLTKDTKTTPSYP
jgi:hypothetical protein